MKRIILGLVILSFGIIGCAKEDEGYDPFGSSAQKQANESKSSAPTIEVTSQSEEKELFIKIPEEVEATTDKNITISGETLPGAEVTFWDQTPKKVTANSEGKFSFDKNFISISDQNFKLSAKLASEEVSEEIILKPNKEYKENLDKQVEETKRNQSDIPSEYLSALRKAGNYSDTMSMSKAGIYDQLVSEHGENFSAEAAQYAVDNLKADFNANALKKAKNYRDTMNMSPESIREQLVSEHGEKFTPEQAAYAIQNLN